MALTGGIKKGYTFIRKLIIFHKLKMHLQQLLEEPHFMQAYDAVLARRGVIEQSQRNLLAGYKYILITVGEAEAVYVIYIGRCVVI